MCLCSHWLRISLFSEVKSAFFSLSPFFPTSPLDKPNADLPELVRDNPASVPVVEYLEVMEEESWIDR